MCTAPRLDNPMCVTTEAKILKNIKKANEIIFMQYLGLCLCLCLQGQEPTCWNLPASSSNFVQIRHMSLALNATLVLMPAVGKI